MTGDARRPEAAVAVQMSGVGVVLDGFRALDGINLAVHRGEWVTVIGPNGAGKSTLLRALGGLVPHSGAVQLFGTPLGRLPRRERARRVAFVPQAPVVPPGMAVLDYVLLGRTPYIQPLARESADDLVAVDLVLDRLDLARFAHRRLESLSGGERQRVFLARALAQGATLLLLDEPTAALDIGHQQEVLELVDRLRHEAGLTVVTTMHDLSIAGEYADRLVLLAEHYRAHVTIIDGAHGPLVVPVRAVT